MTTEQAIRELTVQQAVELLIARGWTRDACKPCGGAGHFVRESNEIGEGQARAKSRIICEDCRGDGWQWTAPAGAAPAAIATSDSVRPSIHRAAAYSGTAGNPASR